MATPTAVQVFRHLIADVDPNAQVLSDEHAAVYLSLNGVADPAAEAPSWQVRYAAADALDAIAVSEALVGKVIRTQDLSTDGAKLAAALREQADRLRARAANDEMEASDYDAGITVLEFEPYPSPMVGW